MITAAIMQPYFLPYIGYFQMIKAVDKFVFYDDVNFIKGGWINRNKLLISNEARFITIPLLQASPNKIIKEIEYNKSSKDISVILKTVAQNYGKAPHFTAVYPLFERIITQEARSISELAIHSICEISNYLGLKTEFLVASSSFPDTKKLERSARILEICHRLDAGEYINAIGGQELYCKNVFQQGGVRLKFIRSKEIEYNQCTESFTPWLSIIDVIMYNTPEQTRMLLDRYELI